MQLKSEYSITSMITAGRKEGVEKMSKRILACLLIVAMLGLNSCTRIPPSGKYMKRSDFMDMFHTNINQFNQVGMLLNENFDYFTYQKNQRHPTDGLYVVNGKVGDAGRESYFSDEEWSKINDLFQLYNWQNSETEEGRPLKIITDEIYFYFPCKVRMMTLGYNVLNKEGEPAYLQLIYASVDDIGLPFIEAAAVETEIQRWRDFYGYDIQWTGEGSWYVNE